MLVGEELYKCENCNKEFYAFACHRKGKHKFCSMKCQHEWRTGKNEIVKKKGKYKKCPICGKEFYCYPYEINTKKTCSMDCNYELQRLEGVHQGENCNFWIGGYDSYRGKNWYGQRNKARIRDKNICQICGKTLEEQDNNMIVHHIVPFRFFKNDYRKANDLDNLICVCHNCHAKQESHQWHEVPLEYQYLLKGVKPQLKPPAGNRYTQEEIDFIKENYDKMTYEKLANILNRSKNSVTDKISTLHLYKGNSTVFTEKEIVFIKQNYFNKPKSFFEKEMPHIKYNTIKSFANRLGLKKEIIGLKEEEKNIIKTYYPIHGINYVCKLLPNRDKKQIKAFIDNNKIKKQDNTERSQ